jgi:hypothetical protein
MIKAYFKMKWNDILILWDQMKCHHEYCRVDEDDALSESSAEFECKLCGKYISMSHDMSEFFETGKR